MMNNGVKSILRQAYERSVRLLPAAVRDELNGYRQYRSDRVSMKDASAQLPFWERREKSGVARERVRIGFVGAGQYAQHHLHVLHNLDQVEVSALLTTGASRAQRVADKYGITRLFSDPDAFFSLKDIDAYIVVVPIQFLKSVSLQALRTGKPVLMEKPPGVTSIESAELLTCARQNRTFGMVCMNRRFYSVIEHGLAALASCGPIRGVTAEIPQAITKSRQSRRLGEYVYDRFFIANSIHGIDLVRYVLGDPLHVHSLARPNNNRRNAAASFAAILEYPSGVVGTITDLWDTPDVWRLKIIAEMGWLEFEEFDRGWFVNADREKAQIIADPVDTEFRTGLYAQDLHFIEAVRAGGTPLFPACLLPDAHKTMVLMENIMSSSLGTGESAHLSLTGLLLSITLFIDNPFCPGPGPGLFC